MPAEYPQWNDNDVVLLRKIVENTAAIQGGGGAVDSVNGQTGVVTITKSDVGLGNADNTSDASKPISTAAQTALSAKATAGLATASGITIQTSKLLGRTTAATGALEEISVGTSLSLSSGSVNTIQDIRTSASPVFAGLTVSSAIAASVTGNAGTATVLQTARNINGVSFNGSADVTVPAAAGTLSGSTLASGVTASSLTSAAGGSFGTGAYAPAPASVTGLRKGAGAASADTAAVAGTDYITPTTIPGAPSVSNLTTVNWVAAFEANRLPVISDGTALSTWTDFSSNLRDATQSGAARPLYKVAANGINGNAVVRFSSGTYMQTASGGQSMTSSWYMAAVIKLTSLSGVSTFTAFGEEATGKRRELVKRSNGASPANVPEVNGFSSDVTGVTALTTGTPYLVEAYRSGTTVTLFLNGIQQAVGTPTYNAFTSAVITLGGNNSGGENLLGDLALALFLDSAPSGATLSLVRSYVATTYGITVSGGATTGVLPAYTSGGGLAPSAVSDSGSDVIIGNRRLVASSNQNNREHQLTVTEPNASPTFGLNVLRLKQVNPQGYSCVYGVGHDVADGVEGYGFAVGWGNTSVPAALPFGSCGYYEVYNALTSTFYPYRVIQTNSTINVRRMDIDDDINFYTRGTGYPNEVKIMTLKNDGTGIESISDIATTTAGKTLKVKSGTNALAGTVTLVAGTATITSTAIDVNTVIVFSEISAGGTPGLYQPLAAVSAGSAVVTSAATDTSTYNWVALKVN